MLDSRVCSRSVFMNSHVWVADIWIALVGITVFLLSRQELLCSMHKFAMINLSLQGRQPCLERDSLPCSDVPLQSR
jgi:hypothetical protein